MWSPRRVVMLSGAGGRSAEASDGPDELLPCEQIEAGGAVTAPYTPDTPVPPETRTITLPQLRQLLGSQLRGRLVAVTPSPEGGLALECRGPSRAFRRNRRRPAGVACAARR